jgi:MFS transporter, CP family, cyanate transporter
MPASMGGIAFLIGLAAFNLRPGITTVGPVLDRIRDDLGISGSVAGALTSIPVFAFAVCALLASGISRRVRAGRAVALGSGLIAIGLVFRVLGNEATLLLGTVVGSVGIAIVAVILPVVVRMYAGPDLARMTAIFTASLQFGAAAGFIASVPLSTALGGWRQDLFVWCVPAAIAGGVWSRLPGGSPTPGRGGSGGSGGSGWSEESDPASWRGPAFITVFFGLQAAVAFVVIGWLPSVLIDADVSATSVGVYMGLLAALAVPVSLVLPRVASRTRDLSSPILFLTCCTAAGVFGFILAPGSWTVIWVVLLGTGLTVFSLALMLITISGKDLGSTARLSAIAQGGGYLLAAPAPIVFGAIRDSVAGWRIPMLTLLGLVAVQAVMGYLAGRTTKTQHNTAS